MKTQYVEEGSSLRHLDVEVEAGRLSLAYDEGLDSLRKRVKLPGFRKGKTPKNLIKSRYHDDVMSQVLQDIVPRLLHDALDEHELNPISEPKISNLESEVGKPLKFRASFEIMPQIEVRDYENIEATQPTTEFTDEQVEEGLEKIRDNQGRWDPVEDRGARDHDLLGGRLVETPQDGGAAIETEEVSIELGSEAYHASLHEKAQGAEAGSSIEFVASFPVDSPDPKRAGKTFDARFELIDLKEKILPDLDDEFAKDVGEFEDLEALRRHLRATGEEEARKRDELELRNGLLSKLIESNVFDVPEVLVEHELDSRIEDAARGLIRQGVDPRKAPIDWQAIRGEQRESAHKSVSATILLDRIADQEKLEEDDKDVERELERAAEAGKRSVEALRAQMTKDGTLEQLRRNLRREKAFDFIKSHARLK